MSCNAPRAAVGWLAAQGIRAQILDGHHAAGSQGGPHGPEHGHRLSQVTEQQARISQIEDNVRREGQAGRVRVHELHPQAALDSGLMGDS